MSSLSGSDLANIRFRSSQYHKKNFYMRTNKIEPDPTLKTEDPVPDSTLQTQDLEPGQKRVHSGMFHHCPDPDQSLPTKGPDPQPSGSRPGHKGSILACFLKHLCLIWIHYRHMVQIRIHHGRCRIRIHNPLALDLDTKGPFWNVL